MNKHNQDGAINVLLIPLILASLALVAALGFGSWAFAGRQDYKNNVDQKIAAAIATAKQEEGVTKDKQYAEAAKLPLKTYNGPEQFGTIMLQYPKTWSAYVDASGESGQAAFDGYFNPDVVPSVADENSTFALRIQVINQTYSEVVQGFDNQEGATTITSYALPKVPKVVGVKLTGQISNEKKGVMIVLPVRDKTLQVYTEVEAYQNDFNNIILPNLSFSP